MLSWAVAEPGVPNVTRLFENNTFEAAKVMESNGVVQLDDRYGG
jgi:hypothetical protein